MYSEFFGMKSCNLLWLKLLDGMHWFECRWPTNKYAFLDLHLSSAAQPECKYFVLIIQKQLIQLLNRNEYNK